MESIVVNWNMAGVNANAFEYNLGASGRSTKKDPRTEAILFAERLSNLIEKVVIETRIRTEDAELARFVNDARELTVRKIFDVAIAAHPQTQKGKDLQKNLCAFAKTHADNRLGIILSGTYHKALKETNGRFFVHNDSALPISASRRSVKKQVSAVPNGVKRYGGKFFSKADMKLKERTFCVTNLDTANVARFFRSCTSSKGLVEYWSTWFDDIASQCCEKFATDAKIVFPIALFDVFLTMTCRHAILSKPFQSSSTTLDDLIVSFEALLRSMCTDKEKKAAAMSLWISWLMKVYDPDVLCFQEFDGDWMRGESKRGTWDQVQKEYAVIEPVRQKKDHAKLLLLVKIRGKGLRLDRERTKLMTTLLVDDAFLNDVVESCIRSFDPKRTSWLAKGKISIADAATRVRQRMAVAIMYDADERRVLVVAAHAHSDGTDNRLIVQAASALRDALERECCESDEKMGKKKKAPFVIFAIDANCKTSFSVKDVEGGSATQDMFLSFATNTKDWMDCYSRRNPTSKDFRDRLARFFYTYDISRLSEVEDMCKKHHHSRSQKSLMKTLVETYGPEPSPDTKAPPGGKFPLTVNKQRTFIQTQLHKARVRDQSTKDWIFLGVNDADIASRCKCEGMAINRLPPLIDASENANSPRLWRQSRAMWDTNAYMPNPNFPSDHALVVCHFAWPRSLATADTERGSSKVKEAPADTA